MKIAAKIIGTVIITLIALAGYFVYKTEYRKEHLNTYTSSDKVYRLEIYQIGEPDWPFGSVKGRMELKKGIKTLCGIDFTQHNDGGGVYIEEDDVVWYSDCITVSIWGEGQSDIYTVYFDGTYSVKPKTSH